MNNQHDETSLKSAIALALATPNEANVGEVIKAMRQNPPVVGRVMNSLGKGQAAKVAAMIDAFWRRTLPF